LKVVHFLKMKCDPFSKVVRDLLFKSLVGVEWVELLSWDSGSLLRIKVYSQENPLGATHGPENKRAS
jgi:hypothetical protein